MSTAGEPLVSVSGNPWLAGSLALASSGVAAGYGVRAEVSPEPLLPGLVALGFGLLAALWLLVALDARVPRLVMDRHGVRLRFARTWVGIAWSDFGEATIRTRPGWWRDDLIVPAGAAPDSDPLSSLGLVATWQAGWMKRWFGSAYAVPVGWSARVQGAHGDLRAAISRLQESADATQPMPTIARPVVPGTLRARLRDPRPAIAAGITIGANALQLHPIARRVVMPEAQHLHRADPELIELADPAAAPTHVIAVPGDQDAPRPEPTIGPVLVRARLGLALTVPQLAVRARIPVHVIEAIETDDFAISGGDFYARGQLRTLCRVLGLDVVPLLAAYDAEPAEPEPAQPEAALDTPRPWSFGVAIVVVVALGWSLGHLVEQPTAAGQPPGVPSAPARP